MNKKILWALIALFFASNLATAAYFLNKQQKINIENKTDITAAENVKASNQEIATSDIAVDKLEIDWLSNLEPVEFADISNSLDREIKFYRAGKVTSGKYKGGDLIIALYQMMGDSVIRAVYLDNKFFILSQNSAFVDNGDNKLIFNNAEVDTTSFIDELKLPKEITVVNTKARLILQGQSMDSLDENKSRQEVFLGTNGEKVYSKQGGNFLVQAKDGTFFEYYLYLEFLSPEFSDLQNSRAPQVINLKLLNGDSINREYVWYGGGCGNILDIVKINKADLQELGINNQGSVFYELKDKNFKLPEQELPILQEIYNSYFPGYDATISQEKDKISYESFLADHPVIYWQDSLGRWIQFRDNKYQQAVECGKPVIYLYPEKTMDVNVQVNPAGGFTKTEPAYKNGWMVKAEPNGNIYNYDDKINYPYLFWEGYALGYNQPKTGFVTASSDIEKFLREKLAQQGLVGREIDEFIEFWAPKMKSAPYYFVTFIPQTEFDKLAPLTVSPSPKTVIRVFMDYTPLERPMRVREQILSAPARNGFTVVEWGGALHK